MRDQFTLKIETANAAFEDRKHSEVARILREIAKKVDEGESSGNCRDINGNTVGKFSF